MTYNWFDVLKLLGSLGLFLFGMKLMSESLQRVAGTKMRSILSTMTSNKYMGILTGFIVTAVIQSSSATTVMLVSFVNAGLLSLTESIGVIMGANIGTTVTAWLVLIFGFKFEISLFTLPLIAVALPFLFSKVKKRNSIGEMIVGFSIIFMGLQLLKDSAPNIENSPHLVEYITGFSSYGFGSVLIYLLIGTFLTVVVQSSSAVMALTLVFCHNGWINYEMAAAMILGMNIGTTITANLAALVANVSAKRAAVAHTIFNVIGVASILIFYYPFLRIIGSMTQLFGYDSPIISLGQAAGRSRESMLLAMSLYHTVFNILNTLLVIGFVPFLEMSVKYIIPYNEDDEEFTLKYINTGLLSTGEIALVQARNEMIVYMERVIKMFAYARELFDAKTNNKFNKYYLKIKKCEDISDRMELEIASYLTRISEESVSTEGSEKISSMLNLVSNIESLADSINNLSNTLQRKSDSKITFNKDIEKNIIRLLSFVDELLQTFKSGLEKKEANLSAGDFKKSRKQLAAIEKSLKQEHFKSLHKGKYKTSAGIIYSDAYTDVINIGKQTFNVIDLFFSDGRGM
ncbi:MAG: Na/Pi cotransporter family protein [Bacteroidales bacterium]|nr:Na/Pi cotransporter family protein [Bacteroidales bacterium]